MKRMGWMSLGLLLIGSVSFGQDPEKAAAEVKSAPQATDRIAKQEIREIDRLMWMAEVRDRLSGRQFSDVFGLDFVEADPVLRAQLEIPDGQGVVIIQVKPGGLAEQAGLKSNDVMIKLNDQAITSVEQAKEIISKVGNKAVRVELFREGKPLRNLSLVGPEHGTPDISTPFWIGVTVSDVDATLRSHLTALPAKAGLIANDIVPNSPAAKVGVRKNDILVKLNDMLLASQEGLVEQVQKSNGKEITLELLRAGKTLTLAVTPERRPSASDQVSSEIEDLLIAIKSPQDKSSNNVIKSSPPYFSYFTPHGMTERKTDDIAKNPKRVDDGNSLILVPDQFGHVQLRRGRGLVPMQVIPSPAQNAKLEQEIKDLSNKIEELRKAIKEMNENYIGTINLKKEN